MLLFLRSLIATVFLIGFCLAAMPGGAAAQILDYGKLFGSGQQQAEEPAQSLPRPVPSSGFSGPNATPATGDFSAPALTAGDYERLTGAADPMLGVAKNAVNVFRKRLTTLAGRIPEIGAEIVTTLEIASPTGRPGYFLAVALFTVLLLMIGRSVSRLYSAFLARPFFISIQRPDPVGYLEKVPVLAYRILLTLVGVVFAIGVAGIIGLFFYQDHDPTLVTAITIFAIYGAICLVDTIWRMALAPFLSAYRLPAIDDRRALRLYAWLVSISIVAIVCFALTLWLEALAVPEDILTLLTVMVNFVAVVSLIAALQSQRGIITRIIFAGRAPHEASWVTLAVARLWAPLATLYLIAAWGKVTFELVMGIDTGSEALIVPYAVLILGLIAYALASYAIERVFHRQRRIARRNAEAQAVADSDAEERRVEEQSHESFGDAGDLDGDGSEEGGGVAVPDPVPPMRSGSSMRSFEDLARRVASLLALGASAWAMLYFWGGIEIFAENAAFGIAEDVIDVIFLGYIAYHAVRIWMDQKIEEEGGFEVSATPLDGEGGGAGASRLATLLPLVRNFVLTVILIAVALILASEMGINVAPLFAGAGIVGLAIGFGSQALVRDILSGAFFLLDDAFRKGEYIDVGDVKGTVEKISLRSFQLRHHLGMLHTIPFGQIQFLTNFSRDWVMMKLPLRVTYDTDVEKVRKLIKKLGIQLLDDPVVGDHFIQPLKSQGVIHMEDSAMIIRVKFMTKPGDQWVVRKRVYQEIRDLFDREGIKFAHREVTVRIPDLPNDRAPSEAEVKAIGAAARRVGDEVAEEMLATGTAGPVGPIDDR